MCFTSKAVKMACVTPFSAEFEDQMSAARELMKKRRAVLHELADMSRPPRQWRWLNADVLQAVHLEQLAEHGGRRSGTRRPA